MDSGFLVGQAAHIHLSSRFYRDGERVGLLLIRRSPTGVGKEGGKLLQKLSWASKKFSEGENYYRSFCLKEDYYAQIIDI